MQNFLKSVVSASVLGWCWCAVGCGGGESFGSFPVRGKVLVNGEPAAHVSVVLHRTDFEAFEKPAGETDENGEFQLTTRVANDGAAPGEYLVTLSWHKPLSTGSDPDYGPELLPKQFQDPKKSGQKVVIEERSNELPPFDIKF